MSNSIHERDTRARKKTKEAVRSDGRFIEPHGVKGLTVPVQVALSSGIGALRVPAGPVPAIMAHGLKVPRRPPVKSVTYPSNSARYSPASI